MPKYEVVQPIETNGTLFVPLSHTAPKTAKSFSHGRDIPVDASGLIELTEEEAAAIPHAVHPLKKYGEQGTGNREQDEPEAESKKPTANK
jgi:hypothetical protein